MVIMQEMLGQFERRPPASDTALLESERALSVHFPADYADFLRLSDGGEGFIGPVSYLIMWSTEELPAMQRAYQVDTYAPGFLIFGSSGGGEAYGFDMRASKWSVVQMPFVGMDWSLAEPLATTFGEFLTRLHESRE